MRLGTYITESDLKAEIKALLKKTAAPFFKEVRGVMTPFLFRGTDRGVDTKKQYKVVNRRKDRNPRFIGKTLTTYLDKESKKMWGFKARSAGIFTSAHISAATAYGSPKLFVPIGKFKYAWHNDVHSLYGFYDELTGDHSSEEEMWDILRSINMRRTNKDAKAIFDRELEEYQTTNLKKYLNNPNRWSEAIFDVDKYYIMNDNEYTREVLVELANDR